MPLDGIFLSLVKTELLPLVNSRVDKIHQPSREELVITMRTPEGNRKLLFNISASSARIHITDAEIENPKAPPMFCMLMRKHLSGGKLSAIRQDGFERILYFDFDTINEMGDPAGITLAGEIMGRRSNLIVIDENSRVIDAMKRVTFDMSSVRPVMPGCVYDPPPREEKLCITDISKEALTAAFDKLPDQKLTKALVKVIEGISPAFAQEAEHFACRGNEKSLGELSEDETDRLVFFLKRTAADITSGKAKFTVVTAKDGSLNDFYFCDASRFGALGIKKYFPDACTLLDSFYTQRDLSARMKQRASDLFRLIISTGERVARRVAVQKQELKDCADKEKQKIFGDLIMSNLYRLEKGMAAAEVENFYQEDCPVVSIPLDKRLTPSQNAQKYYNAYRKFDTAEKRLVELIKSGEEELDYIDSVFDLLARATTEAELSELRSELAEQGYAKAPRYKGKPPKAQPPLRFISDDGFEILIGRNNKQNDTLTLKSSEKTDIWLHTKNIHGSHTVIKCKGEEPPESTILQAAQLAAYHSKARESSQVPVDYTYIRYVKKPGGAKPGMVIFTNNRTLYVTPDEELAKRLKK